MQRRLCILALIFMPAFCFASWQIAGDAVRTPGQEPTKLAQAIPKNYQTNHYYDLIAQKGLLIYTIRDYAHQHYWKLNWMVPTNIMNNVTTKFAGPDFQHVLNQLVGLNLGRRVFRVLFHLEKQTQQRQSL